MEFRFHRPSRNVGRTLLRGGLVAATLALSGCASLPVSGPTGNQILKEQRDPTTGLSFHLVPVVDFDDLPPQPVAQRAPIDLSPIPPTDLIGPGDRLSIAIYETGVPLFAPGALPGDAGANTGLAATAKLTNLPQLRVDDRGDIIFPFVGRINVAGRTASEVQSMIRRAVHGMSENPQVVVSIADSVTNSVLLGGEVGRSGRLVLQTNRETVADAIALGGGYRGDAKDLVVRIERSGTSNSYRLSEILNGPAREMYVRPGDRIDVIRQVLTFTVMGGSSKVDLVPFASSSLSLAEAVAMSGGANPNAGDAKAIFVFRLIPDAEGKLVPTVYHVNMMRAGSLFLSQRFVMRDKDVLYVGNAAFNQPAKMTQVLSQLFAPILTVGSALNLAR